MIMNHDAGHGVCSTLLVAAPASGHGKTTVVAALARWHRRCGRRVRVFKCGPDFLDPMIHTLASGAPCENLDWTMTGETEIRWRLTRAARQADVILIEGVMGLYDSDPSTAALAKRLGVPILLVVDASSMGGSFGAIAWGLKHYRDGAPITHAFANRVGSAFHMQLCRESLPPDIAWAGALPRDERWTLPERHLGLLPAGEITDLEARLDAAAEAIAQGWLTAQNVPQQPPPLATATQVDASSLTREAKTQTGLAQAGIAPKASPPLPPAPMPPMVAFPEVDAPLVAPRLAGRTVAVARDAAFCFLYPANLECLQQLGARVAFFSPLQDTALPPCDAVWLPGGYPELHAEEIATNSAMRTALAAHVAAGKPLLAECGGMMACFEALETLDGKRVPMFGLLPGVTRMQPRLAGLGLLRAELPHGTLTGHTFHYSHAETPLAPWGWASKVRGQGGEAIYRRGSVIASYAHWYFPSCPEAIAAWLSGR